MIRNREEGQLAWSEPRATSFAEGCNGSMSIDWQILRRRSLVQGWTSRWKSPRQSPRDQWPCLCCIDWLPFAARKGVGLGRHHGAERKGCSFRHSNLVQLPKVLAAADLRHYCPRIHKRTETTRTPLAEPTRWTTKRIPPHPISERLCCQ